MTYVVAIVAPPVVWYDERGDAWTDSFCARCLLGPIETVKLDDGSLMKRCTDCQPPLPEGVTIVMDATPTGIKIDHFTYEVKLGLELTIDHALLLKRAAAIHYDALVREYGEAGPIKALLTRATLVPGCYPMSAHDADVCRKALEQCRTENAYERRLLLELQAALTEVFERCNERWAELVSP